MDLLIKYKGVLPLFVTFGSAFFFSHGVMGRKWQNSMIGMLGILCLFFIYLFFTFNPSGQIESYYFDIRYNKISIYVAMIFCGSLFASLYPIRETVNFSPRFLFYVAGAMGIILSNNLPTFFLFWCFQRTLPLWDFLKRDSIRGGTYIFQHLLTFICLISLMILAFKDNLLFVPMTEMPASFFTWPVLILAFIIVYEAHGLFPLHSWVHDVIGTLPWYEFSAIFLSRSGVLLFVQLILPHLKTDPDLFKILLLSLSIFSSIYWSIRGLLETNLNRTTNYFYVAQTALILTGLQANESAVKGAYLHMLVISLSGAALFSIQGYVRHDFHLKRSVLHYGLAGHFPKLATLYALFGLCLIGIPLGGSFVVEDLVITGLLEYRPYLGLGHILATCLNGILFFFIFNKIFLGQTPFKKSQLRRDMPTRQMLTYYLSLGILLLLGIFPSLFLERITW